MKRKLGRFSSSARENCEVESVSQWDDEKSRLRNEINVDISPWSALALGRWDLYFQFYTCHSSLGWWKDAKVFFISSRWLLSSASTLVLCFVGQFNLIRKLFFIGVKIAHCARCKRVSLFLVTVMRAELATAPPQQTQKKKWRRNCWVIFKA